MNSTNLVLAAMDIAGYSVSTKTLGGWVFGVGLLALGLRVMSVMREASNDRDSEQRNEKIKMAWIVLACGIGVVVVLQRIGIITFTDITQSLENF
jgi:hypothetical protein